MIINKHDTNGIKPLLGKGELGYDDYGVGGDSGRVYVGTGSENIPLAKKSEIDSHGNRIDNPHSVTKTQVGLGNVDNTADANKNVLSATKWTTARTITLSGDVAGSASMDGTANVSITTTVQPNSVTLGTDTTGNYVAGVTAGQGITISGTAGEGWSPTIALSALDLTLFPTSNFKKSVKVATTADITLSGVQTIDGISVVVGDRVLVKNQTTTSQNGIYVVAASTWTRALDANSSSKIASAIVAVDSGTVNGGKLFDNDFKTTDTLDTTSMLWNMNIDDGSLLTAGSTSVGIVKYNGTTATAGNFDGGTTTPTGATRLNYGGYFYPTYLNLVGSVDTTSASSHVFVETGTDGFVRPKTLANFKTEIFASPTLVTPNIGVATGTSFNSITGLSATTPLMNGTAAVGTSVTVARADHVHPIDTSRAPLVSPAFTGTPTVNGYSVSPFTGFKNYIINGNFDVWQRGITQTSTGYDSDDRWSNSNVGSTKTHSLVMCTDTERALFNANNYSRTVVTSVAGASNYCIKIQRVEDVNKLAGKTVTLSFWAKANSNKNIALELGQSFGTGGSPSVDVVGVGSQLISLTSTWQKKKITITLPSIVGKTLGTDGLQTTSTYVAFWFDAGSSFNSRTSNLGQQSGTFDIAQVQLEEGSVATPFEQRPYGLELSLCQRYFSRGLVTARGYATGPSAIISVPFYYPVSMRVVPTLTLTDRGGRSNLSSIVIGTPGDDVYSNRLEITSAASGDFRALHDIWTAEAEL